MTRPPIQPKRLAQKGKQPTTNSPTNNFPVSQVNSLDSSPTTPNPSTLSLLMSLVIASLIFCYFVLYIISLFLFFHYFFANFRCFLGWSCLCLNMLKSFLSNFLICNTIFLSLENIQDILIVISSHLFKHLCLKTSL